MCGVPQGCVLRPKLFLLCVKDFVNVSGLVKCVLSADDATFLCSGEHVDWMLEMINDDQICENTNLLQTYFSFCFLSFMICVYCI